MLVVSPERVAGRAVSLAETNREFLEAAWHAATVGSETPIPTGDSGMLTVAELRVFGPQPATLAIGRGCAQASAQGDTADAAVDSGDEPRGPP